MTWHTFFGAVRNPHLWYLPAVYATVCTVQLGYVAWVAVQWFRVPQRPAYAETRDELR